MRTPPWPTLLPIAVVAIVLAACTGGTDGGSDGEAPAPAADADEVGADAEDPTGEVDGDDVAALVEGFAREETLITSGNQWGPPSSWNPIPGSGDATGVRGLLYEPLFVFDTFTLELEPWLAEHGEWVADDVYEVVLRDDVTWSDGEALTSDDVVFTFELARDESIAYHGVWDWLESVEALDDRTARFTFSDPRYQPWVSQLHTRVIVPEHTFGELAGEDLMTWANDDEPIGSGPYRYVAHDTERLVWERNDDWWGQAALDLQMAPRYVVDLVSSSHTVALGQLLQGELDLNNDFLPGVATLIEGDYGIQTFFDDEPYTLSASTVMLIPNAQRTPLDDPAFRRALAHSIDLDGIVEGVYGGVVAAAHPSGLLPLWEGLYDDEMAEEHGFEHDPAAAQQLLADAGYEDHDGDGSVESPDGAPIELSLFVPEGWTEWVDAAQVIADGAQAAGIDLVAESRDSARVDEARTTGDFDLVLSSRAGLSSTPWTFYDHVFEMPVQDQMWSGNFGRFPAGPQHALTEQLARTAGDDPAFGDLVSQLQQEHLEALHVIPLWYSGLWAQYSNQVWTNWPAAGDAGPDVYPSTWGGLWNLGSVKMLAELEPAGDV